MRRRFALVLFVGFCACDSRLVTLGQRPSVGSSAGSSATGGLLGGGSGSGSGGAGAVGAAGSSFGGTESAGENGAGSGGTSGTSGADGAGGSGGSGGTSGAAGGMGKLHFGSPARIVELDSPEKDDNPTLTADRRDIFFTTTRGGDGQVWQAHREDPEGPFDEPTPVDAVNTAGDDTSPAISGDGLTLWVGEERDGGIGKIDIWFWTRPTRAEAWRGPTLAMDLSSIEDDIPRPPGMKNTVMPLGSRRQQAKYLTYFAARVSASAAFGEPKLVEELVFASANTIDGFLTEDGLMLFYSSVVSEDNGNLFYARRAKDTEQFGAPVPIAELNREDTDERDPWISPDGKHFFFSSNRSGDHAIYESIVTIE